MRYYNLLVKETQVRWVIFFNTLILSFFKKERACMSEIYMIQKTWRCRDGLVHAQGQSTPGEPGNGLSCT